MQDPGYRYGIRAQIRKARANLENYRRYDAEWQALAAGEFTATSRFPEKWLLQKEEKLFRAVRKKSIDRFAVYVTLSLEKLSGAMISRKQNAFGENELLALARRVEDKSGGFYNDQEIWDAICRVERGKVSNRMRFSIYKRDGYRCCRCGRRESTWTDLEIDHIIPIAKGGKTEYKNLQTLCHRCNMMKGDRLDF